MKASFVASGTMVVLSVPLAWGLGIFGMALTIFLGAGTMAGYYLWQYRKLLASSLSTYFPWKKLASILLIAVASTVTGAMLLSSRIPQSANASLFDLGWNLSLSFALTAVIYLGLLLVFGFISLKPDSPVGNYLGRLIKIVRFPDC
jgi:hypothetical protein